MHVGTTVGNAKGIDNLTLGPANPAPVVSVLPIVDRCPADVGRLQSAMGRHDGLGDLPREPSGVDRVLSGAEACHGSGRRVGVRGGHHHAVDGDSAATAGHDLGLVDQGLRHHAGVDDNQRDLCRTVVEHHAAHEERIMHHRRRFF